MLKQTGKRKKFHQEKVIKTDAQWRQQLTREQYRITREKGAERAYTGEFWDHYEVGSYHCVCCDLPLFNSENKFDSGSGWPSFSRPVTRENISTKPQLNFSMMRVEVNCSRCDAHLGHVFNDGPRPSGIRYNINSAALSFIPENSESEDNE